MPNRFSGKQGCGTARHLHQLVHRFVLELDSFLQKPVESSEWKRIVPGSTGHSEATYTVRAARTFLLRTYHQLNAIGLLSLNGMAAQAKLQLRSLVEIAIDFRYMATNPNDLSRLYLLHRGFSLWNDGNDLLKDGEKLPPKSRKGLELLEPEKNDFLALKETTEGPTKSNQRSQKSWSRHVLHWRAKKGNEHFKDSQDLHRLYKLLSVSSHGEARCLKDYIIEVNGSLSLRLCPSWHLEVYVLYFSLVSATQIFLAAREIGAPIRPDVLHFDIGLDQTDIDQLMEYEGLIESVCVD